MSVYTTVTREELSAWLTRYSLGALVEHRGIAAGIENTNYFVTTSEGRYVLTLFEKLTPSELPFYLELMEHLAENGIPSARPLRDRSGRLLGELNGKPAAFVSFLGGKDVEHPTVEHCGAVGAMLARIHLAGETYSNEMENPRGLSWWRAVTPELLPHIGKATTALLEGEVRYHVALALPDMPRGAVHADLFRDNVLFESTTISGVIDFYFACTDRWLYDVAICANDWCITKEGALDTTRTAAMLEPYARVRPFTDAERQAWPVMLRAAALRFWVSRLYDFHLPRAGELTHAKDPAHFEQILASHIKLHNEQPALPL
jgi:homoserine kinase type II